MPKPDNEFLEKESVEKNLKLLAGSSFIVFIGVIISKIFSYIYRIIIARNFGAETYGLFSLAIMVLGLFVTFSSFGILEGLERFLPQSRGKRQFAKIRYIIRLSSIILLFSSIFAAAILFFSKELISIKIFNNSDLIIFLQFFSFLIPLWIFSNLFLSIIISFENIKWGSFLSNILPVFSRVIFIIIFVMLGMGSSSVFISYALGFALLFFSALFIVRYKIIIPKEKKKLENEEKRIIMKEFIYYSMPFVLISLVTRVQQWADSLFIGIFLNATEVGVYNAALPIAYLILFSGDLFMPLFSPLINKEFSKNNIGVVRQLSKQTTKWIFIISLPLFLLIFLFPGVFINFLFGSKYLGGEIALRILSVGVFVSTFSRISQKLILLKGKSKIMMYDIIFTLLANILLDLYLVPIYGINGAAFSTSLTLSLFSLLLLIQAKYITSIMPIKRKILKIFYVSLIPLLIILIIKNFIIVNPLSLFLLGIFFVMSYTLLIILTKCLDENDWMIINVIRKKVFYKRH